MLSYYYGVINPSSSVQNSAANGLLFKNCRTVVKKRRTTFLVFTGTDIILKICFPIFWCSVYILHLGWRGGGQPVEDTESFFFGPLDFVAKILRTAFFLQVSSQKHHLIQNGRRSRYKTVCVFVVRIILFWNTVEPV